MVLLFWHAQGDRVRSAFVALCVGPCQSQGGASSRDDESSELAPRMTNEVTDPERLEEQHGLEFSEPRSQKSSTTSNSANPAVKKLSSDADDVADLLGFV